MPFATSPTESHAVMPLTNGAESSSEKETSSYRLSELGQAALGYAARGWPVFPCADNKRPLVPGESSLGAKDGGLYLATTDEAQIRAWWKRWPRALIGVPTGPKTGFVLESGPEFMKHVPTGG